MFYVINKTYHIFMILSSEAEERNVRPFKLSNDGFVKIDIENTSEE